jgi:hypothetical protein
VRIAIVLVVVVGALVSYLSSAQRDDTGAINEVGELEATDLRVGDCFNEPEGQEVSDVTAVPCAEPHDQEVFAVEIMTGGTFPTTQEQQQFVADRCLPAFESYVGTPYQESDLDIFTLTPTAASWEQGDRAVTCSAYAVDGSSLTGTVQGSNR